MTKKKSWPGPNQAARRKSLITKRNKVVKVTLPKATACPHCGRVFGPVGPVGPGANLKVLGPRPGDKIVCVGCKNITTFDEELKPRKDIVPGSLIQ
jgi:hypothetical protein